jgi:ribosomal-protein-alanine N-acetyltransferase
MGYRDGGNLLGYAGLAVAADEAEVRTIGVAPAAQGRGVGRALLHDLLRAAGPRRVLLEVRCDNEPAIALYESEGFVRVGLRRHYYQPSGADAYTMARPAGATIGAGKITSDGRSAPDSEAHPPQHTIIRGAR